MKRVAGFIIALLALLTANGQNAVEQVADALNRGDIVWLDRNIDALRDSLPEPLMLMGQAIRHANLCRYEQSNRAIEKLLNNHHTTLDNQQISTFYGLLIDNLNNQGLYSEASRLLKGSLSKEDYSYRYFEALSKLRPMRIVAPKGGTTLSFTRKSVGDGAHIHLPVRIGRNTESFIFDTGAAKYNVVSARCAKRYKFRPVIDSLPTTGVGGKGVTSVVTINKIKIGDITIHNPLFLVVADDNMPKDLLGGFELEFVLGNDIMMALGLIEFDMTRNEAHIGRCNSEQPKSCSPMIRRSNGQYYIYVGVDGELHEMQFDTGAVHSALYGNYFALHRDSIVGHHPQKQGRARGFGGTIYYDAYTLSKTTFSVGDAECQLPQIDVATEQQHLPIQQQEFGVFGVDALLRFSHFTINFRDMYIGAK